MIILLSLISFILYTLAAAHGSVANGIRMVGNELQLLVNNNAEVRINATGMTVAGRVRGNDAKNLDEFVTLSQLGVVGSSSGPPCAWLQDKGRNRSLSITCPDGKFALKLTCLRWRNHGHQPRRHHYLVPILKNAHRVECATDDMYEGRSELNTLCCK